jgi:stage II sporulation protein R
LADSDSAQDQLIKQQIRDRIVESMNEWVTDPQNIETARAEIEARLSDFERLVGEELERLGVDQSYTVSFGQVDFPAKLYGNQVYPAGDYEALLITLGKGEGRNWWCVLFPPLCFVEVASGEAVSKTVLEDKEASSEVKVASADPEDKEVKFFIVELLEGLFKWIKSLF